MCIFYHDETDQRWSLMLIAQEQLKIYHTSLKSLKNQSTNIVDIFHFISNAENKQILNVYDDFKNKIEKYYSIAHFKESKCPINGCVNDYCYYYHN